MAVSRPSQRIAAPAMSSCHKRARSPSPVQSSSSTADSPELQTVAKLSKVAIPDLLYASLTCTLPPTCSQPYRPTRLANVKEVEEHYAKYHTHVCEAKGCRTVFPDARFLELVCTTYFLGIEHFAECHDPIIALKRERGEKTFACYIPSCDRVFTTPKGRRLHLIQVHGYPKQFFFGVTNKGVGGLLHKWGQGASLYRGDWKPRTKDVDMDSGSDSGVADSMDGDDNGREDGRERPPYNDPSLNPPSPNSASPPPRASSELDSLSGAMSSLSLVPDKIRFGRGGKKGGFSHFQHPKPVKSSSKPGYPQGADSPNRGDHPAANGKPESGRHHNNRGRNARKTRVLSQEASSTNGDTEMGMV